MRKDRRAIAKIDTRLDRAKEGNFGDHKFEREGVWEMRIDYGPGYRIYYAFDNNDVVILLVGGDKITQDADVENAAIP